MQDFCKAMSVLAISCAAPTMTSAESLTLSIQQYFPDLLQTGQRQDLQRTPETQLGFSLDIHDHTQLGLQYTQGAIGGSRVWGGELSVHNSSIPVELSFGLQAQRQDIALLVDTIISQHCSVGVHVGVERYSDILVSGTLEVSGKEATLTQTLSPSYNPYVGVQGSCSAPLYKNIQGNISGVYSKGMFLDTSKLSAGVQFPVFGGELNIAAVYTDINIQGADWNPALNTLIGGSQTGGYIDYTIPVGKVGAATLGIHIPSQKTGTPTLRAGFEVNF